MDDKWDAQNSVTIESCLFLVVLNLRLQLEIVEAKCGVFPHELFFPEFFELC